MSDAQPNEGQQGYSTGVTYLRTFSNDLSPAMLRLAAALNGFEPPRAEGFDYCELGCGNGDTIVALAAANPGSRFTGVDLSASHIENARRLAERGGVMNVRFVEGDFEALRSGDLPAFDYVCAHGVLSWVSPDKRRASIDVAASLLRPGGLFQAGYNTLPGWAAVTPLRRLMQDGAAAGGGDGLEQAQRGLGLAKLLHDAGAAYFTANPTAKAMLAATEQLGLPYAAHEYLQPHWHPMYFTDMAAEMAHSGLYYIGQLPLHLNYRDLALGPALVALLKGVTDRLTFEGLKDYALNEVFRRDVYIKGAAGRSDATAPHYLETTPFGTFLGASRVAREARLGQTTMTFNGPLFDAVIAAIAEGACPLSDLARRPGLEAFSVVQLRGALLHLALGNQAVPMLRSTARTAPPGAGRFHCPLQYNRMIIEHPFTSSAPIILAAQAAGMGLVVSTLEAVCLRLLTGVQPEARPAWIRAFVERQPLKLTVSDRAVDGPEAQARVLEAELQQFSAGRLPKLLELGIVASVDRA